MARHEFKSGKLEFKRMLCIKQFDQVIAAKLKSVNTMQGTSAIKHTTKEVRTLCPGMS